MWLVIAAPEWMAAAAGDMAGIGSTIGAANGAAAANIEAVLAAGADEVSVAVATVFGAHAQAYRAVSAQAAVFHDQFVQALTAGAESYAAAEAASAASITSPLLNAINAPFLAATGRPLIGNGANGAAGSGA
ncbi:PE family protein, partial [Mycobacterium szulgai]|uniref:PE family protein n=1 Tax=Mycobacterium szulgai TaxID=1787 RepID=UPI00111C0858